MSSVYPCSSYIAQRSRCRQGAVSLLHAVGSHQRRSRAAPLFLQVGADLVSLPARDSVTLSEMSATLRDCKHS